MKDVLWSIDPANDSMPKTIERMHEVADAMKNRHQVNVTVHTGSSVSALSMDMQTRLHLIMLYKMMITTLAEAVPAGSILVQMDHLKSMLQLKMHAQSPGNMPGSAWIEQKMTGIRKLAVEIGSTVDLQADATGIGMLLEMKV
jgi:hypothetical protein